MSTTPSLKHFYWVLYNGTQALEGEGLTQMYQFSAEHCAVLFLCTATACVSLYCHLRPIEAFLIRAERSITSEGEIRTSPAFLHLNSYNSLSLSVCLSCSLSVLQSLFFNWSLHYYYVVKVIHPLCNNTNRNMIDIDWVLNPSQA